MSAIENEGAERKILFSFCPLFFLIGRRCIPVDFLRVVHNNGQNNKESEAA